MIVHLFRKILSPASVTETLMQGVHTPATLFWINETGLVDPPVKMNPTPITREMQGFSTPETDHTSVDLHRLFHAAPPVPILAICEGPLRWPRYDP